MKTIESRNQLGSLISSMGLTGEGAEVGVCEGGFSWVFLQFTTCRLHMIDCWDTSSYSTAAGDLVKAQEMAAKYNVDGQQRAILHRQWSVDAVECFSDNQLDFLYLDANHGYEFVKQDLHMWWPKVKSGGIFAGHDYLDGDIAGIDYGVKRAVDEFVVELGLSSALHVTPEEWPTWYFVKP